MKNSRPIILTFVSNYLPGYKSGGPVRTISNMVKQLGDDLDFRIITADRDMGDDHPYPDVVVDDWNSIGNVKIFYASPRNQTPGVWAHLIRETRYDVLYLNSFFDLHFTIFPLLLRYLGIIPPLPVVIAPRGEFSKEALVIKLWKKWPYIALFKMLQLDKSIIWQASSAYEANDIRNTLSIKDENIKTALVVAADTPILEPAVPDKQQHIFVSAVAPYKICFLSRISPMKNLDYALQVLAGVSIPVEFDIYGVRQDKSYWNECEKLMKKLPGHVAAAYCGEINHEDVNQVLCQYDLFFFPTRGENFGHVIFEAFSAGLPVLISDRTPWRNLQSLGVGWDLPLSEEAKFREAINAHASMDDTARIAQRECARKYAIHIATDKKVFSENLALFTNLMVKPR